MIRDAVGFVMNARKSSAVFFAVPCGTGSIRTTATAPSWLRDRSRFAINAPVALATASGERPRQGCSGSVFHLTCTTDSAVARTVCVFAGPARVSTYCQERGSGSP